MLARLALPIAAALLLSSAGFAAGRVHVEDGERNVEFQPLKRQGSYVRRVFVYGASREKILAALPGPATGPDGFAPKMATITPVSEQFENGRVCARKMRLPGLPEAVGATVEGWVTANGMAFRMTDGLTGGDFTIVVGPERRLPDGDLEVEVTEAGRFHILRSPPRSIFGLPGYIFGNLTPVGWVTEAAGGAAVCKGHIGLFELENVLRRRLGAVR